MRGKRIIWPVALLTLVAGLLPVTAEATPPLPICVAYDVGGPGDHSFNDAVAAGLISAAKRYQISTESTVTIGSEEDRELRIRTFAKKNCDLTIVVGGGYAASVKKVAMDYPTRQFAIVNDASVDLLNVASLVFAENQGGYLAGVAAALLSKKAKIGIIGNSNLKNGFHSGFVLGAQATNKIISISNKSAEGSSGAQAKAMIAQGVDVIFLTIVGSGSDVFKAVISANRNGKKVGLIWVEPDQYLTLNSSASKYILAVVVKRVDRAIVDVIGEAVAGRSLIDPLDSSAGIYGRRYGITSRGIEISLLSPSLIKFEDILNSAAEKAVKLSTMG